jgi:cation diffusion facilitator family transporter
LDGPVTNSSAQTVGGPGEPRVLLVSLVATAVLGVLGIVWGWLAGSQAILFDGAYTGLGLVLSGLSLHASRVVSTGPSTNYPFGREALAPLVIMIQGVALLATLGYAVITSVLAILAGGTDVTAASGMLYGAITGVVAVAVWLYLRSRAAHSDLVRAEAAQWLAGVGLSVGMLIAFGVAAALAATDLAWLAAYVDPALVVMAGLVLFPIPLGMVRQTVRELLEGSPPASVHEPVRAVVDAVSAALGLEAPIVRMSKLGPKLYLEVDYLVEAGRYDTAFADQVRHALNEGLKGQPLDVWLNVELSTDGSW